MEGSAAIVSAIVPCLDEEVAIGDLVRGLLAHGVDEVVVVDGGSRDGTVKEARGAGATVLSEPLRGYGRACAAGVAGARPDASIICFIDGDGSDDPADAAAIIGPVLRREVDFCIASRTGLQRAPGSLTPQQLVAGRLAGWLLRLVYGVDFTDMAPLRAMTRDALMSLGMTERTFGWNLEMQMRVAAACLRIREVPVRCRPRVGGTSKVSGNFGALLPATWTLARTFLRLAVTVRRSRLR